MCGGVKPQITDKITTMHSILKEQIIITVGKYIHLMKNYIINPIIYTNNALHKRNLTRVKMAGDSHNFHSFSGYIIIFIS